MNKPIPCPQLDTSDWREAFAFAGEPGQSNPADVRPAIPDSGISLTGFGVADVVEVGGLIEGENDGEPWRCWGRTFDGDWFYLEAWCDYTGWDCQAGGCATMAKTKDECLRFAMTDEARTLFGIVLS